MDRREFFMGCLGGCIVASGVASCNKSVEKPQEGDLIKIDLATELQTPGSFLRTRGVLVIRVSEGSLSTNFAALEAICPHAGGELEWSGSQSLVVCPVHGSRFSRQGGLVNGPANRGLRTYDLTVSGNILEVRVG